MKFKYLVMLITLALATTVSAGDYNYIAPKKMKSKIESGNEVIIVDIQVEKEFKEHRLPGSVATYAYPVKTDAERGQIDKAIEMFNASGKEVVIVCPRGKGGAKRCYDYMLKNNVPPEKIFILEKGIAGWPYKEMLEKG